MIVVADTTPLCHLVWIGRANLLHQFFGEIQVPATVNHEMVADGAPEIVRQWAARPPLWLTIHEDPEFFGLNQFEALDAGEKAALALALTLEADLILADDKAARSVAKELAIPVTGTLGILERAARLGILDFEKAVNELRSTGFWISETTLGSIKQRLADHHN